MSLPNYLAKIKSAGIYRFVWDKSIAPIQAADTLRLVVGYSEKGPFNTPVYIDNVADFKTIFGNISKKLEKKGVFFHRMALQALASGPILALNLKTFTDSQVAPGADRYNSEDACKQLGDFYVVGEKVYVSYEVVFETKDLKPTTGKEQEIIEACQTKGDYYKTEDNKYKVVVGFKFEEKSIDYLGEQVQYIALNSDDKILPDVHEANVVQIYNTNRFWALDPDVLPTQLASSSLSKYVTITSTDSKETSCTVFLRKYTPTGYDVTVKTWYASRNEEIPSYLEGHEDMKIEDTFAEIYVFRGEFNKTVASTPELIKYFDIDPDSDTVKLYPYITNAFGEQVDTLAALAEDECSNFVGIYRGTLMPYFQDNTNTYISLDLVFNMDNNKHKMLMKLDQDILEKSEDVVNSLNPSGWVYEAAKEATPAVEFALTPIYLKGYNYITISKSETGILMQKQILAALTKYKGLIEALTNNIDIEYHYIVDTFESFGGSGSLKVELSTIAKKKDNCLAILNYPFMQKMVKDKKFLKDNTFDISKTIKDGYIQLPSTTDGASWCAFYTAITLSDGTVKTYCPSAAVVSNLFMEKYGLRQPYSIVAGPNYGLVTADGMVGPDYNFSRSDLDIMEPFGVNCLVYVPRRGTQINSNQTAKQTPVSALSKVHVRELVIYLQDEIAAMLQSYQWEFNTATLRANVKAKADKLLENVQQNGGVYAFKNVCDESNNTDEVINNEMLVLSTSIEPGMGAGKMVQELTIYRKGGISSSAT